MFELLCFLGPHGLVCRVNAREFSPRTPPTKPCMYDRPSVVALRESLSAVAASRPAKVDKARLRAIHERVCPVVDDLKAAGWPPERIIVALKQIADDVGLNTSRRLLVASTPLQEHDAVVVGIVRWCIERYYHADMPRSQ